MVTTFVNLTLTLWPWGHQGMLTLSTPTYDMNMMKIKGHSGYRRQISKFDIERCISDLGGKNSKFRLLQCLRMDLIKYNPMQFHHSHIKTVWRVYKSAKKNWAGICHNLSSLNLRATMHIVTYPTVSLACDTLLTQPQCGQWNRILSHYGTDAEWDHWRRSRRSALTQHPLHSDLS